jgi:hypothetical protein
LAFWIVTILVLGLVAVPWLAPLFIRNEIAYERFALLSALVAVPFTLFAGTLQTVTLDVKRRLSFHCA